MALIFDIETIGIDFDGLDETTQESLTRWIEREAGDEISKYNLLLNNLKEGLGFSPLTGEIVALGVFDTARNKGVVYYQAPDVKDEEWQDGSFTFTLDESFKSFLQDKGFRKIKDENMLHFCLTDINRLYINNLGQLGYSEISTSKLESLAIHGVSSDSIKRAGPRQNSSTCPATRVSIHASGPWTSAR